MKKMVMAICCFIVCGCAAGGQEIQGFMRDPHFTGYQSQLDELESSYLRDDISYPVYLKRKQEIEDRYSAEVQKREDIIHNDLGK